MNVHNIPSLALGGASDADLRSATRFIVVQAGAEELRTLARNSPGTVVVEVVAQGVGVGSINRHVQAVVVGDSAFIAAHASAVAAAGFAPRTLDALDVLGNYFAAGEKRDLPALFVKLRAAQPRQGFRILLDKASAWTPSAAPMDKARVDSPSAPSVNASSALKVALEYARAGILVFPCKADKSPLDGFKWARDASDDPAKVRAMFANPKATMVGLPCGLNGLVVIDCDRKPGKPDGVAAMMNTLTAIGLDVDKLGCPVVTTPTRTGEHLYFRQPAGARIGCSTGSLTSGVDVKGDGGYVVACGSDRGDGVYAPKPGTAALLDSFKAGTIPKLPGVLGPGPIKVLA